VESPKNGGALWEVLQLREVAAASKVAAEWARFSQERDRDNVPLPHHPRSFPPLRAPLVRLTQGAYLEETRASEMEGTPEAWVQACDATRVANEGDRAEFMLKGRKIMVVRRKGVLYCLDSVCYHAGGPLAVGDIEDVDGRSCIICPWHSYKASSRSPLAPCRVGDGVARGRANCTARPPRGPQASTSFVDSWLRGLLHVRPPLQPCACQGATASDASGRFHYMEETSPRALYTRT